MILDALSDGYAWIKAFHVMAVLSWMAGLFYLPRLFVYHAERATAGDQLDLTLRVMERKLYRFIMRPAMIGAWLAGAALASIPGVVDWGAAWSWIKLLSVVAMTGFHIWCGARIAELAEGRSSRSGRSFRIANEVPTLLMIVIVVMVIVRPF